MLLTMKAQHIQNVVPSDSEHESSACTIVNKGIEKDVERGRTYERGPRYPNPLERAASRGRRNDPAIEVDVRPMEKRSGSRSTTFFEDPSDPCAAFEDNLLEPCPHMPICSLVSEVLETPVDITNAANEILLLSTGISFDVPHERPKLDRRRSRAPTTVAANSRTPGLVPCPSQPTPSIRHPEHFGASAYLAQVEASQISPNVSSVSTILQSSSQASMLPTEILQHIYYNLAPADFNSARHTCRSWYINSLDHSLLETMLRRGGYSNFIPSQAIDNHLKVNDEWLMSKRIARECALGPDWNGNGLPPMRDAVSGLPRTKLAFARSASVDFTDVAVHYPGLNSAGTRFIVSSCGKYLIVANGCLVYIYELNRSDHCRSGKVHPGSLRSVTSIICPRRVLACSMDTSSHRYAIAILLDGRMGLVCDITALNTSPSTTSHCESLNSETMKHSGCFQDPTIGASGSYGVRGTSYLDRISLNSSGSQNVSVSNTEPAFVFPGIATTGSLFAPVDESAWSDVFRGDMPESIQTAGPSSRHTSLPRAYVVGSDRQLQEQQDDLTSDPDRDSVNTSMHLEAGPRSLYRNLCSDDDPPRSVAICPQRRCVAFGCSSGIELHWVDALTGQDLNRWFPLTAPSDYLFFLPPRKSVDSAKKLRLISSAAKPGERPAIAERPFGSQQRSSPFWERLSWGSSVMTPSDVGDYPGSSQSALPRLRGDTRRISFPAKMACSDHYRAVPLSDGYHILFTDPGTGLLCLGSDAPVGGPTKLLRKIWFQGPEGMGSPVCYAGGSDLRLGVRVVAAFGAGEEQKVWLFSVPSDIFTANQCNPSPSAGTWLNAGLIHEHKNLDWINWWSDDGLQEWLNYAQDSVPGILPRSIWPVKIGGQMIGTCNSLVDLAIDSGSHMTIWAFSNGGVATVWKIDDGSNNVVERRWVMRDGTVRESEGGGDIEISEPLPSSPDTLPSPVFPQQGTFDGTASSASSVSTVFSTRSQRRHRIDWSQHSLRYDAEGDVLMEDLLTPQRSREELVDGIARIEVEVH
jgi:hypothetical protein